MARHTSFITTKKTEVVSPLHSVLQVPTSLCRQPRLLGKCSAYLLSSPQARGRSTKTTAFPLSTLAACGYNIGLDTVGKRNACHSLPGLTETIILDYLASTSEYHRRVFIIKVYAT